MLAAQHISKRFGGVKALDGVSLQLEAGKVTAIIGENGAGKSTLMKILSGVYADYEGDILFKGQAVRFKDPREAQQAGIAIIHQELNLIPYLSITANLFLGRELKNSWGMLDKTAMRAQATQLLQKLKLNVAPDTLIADLKVGQQQVVEIAKALLYDAEVIIMDEPTSAISESEVEVLFGIIAGLKQEGKAIAYISHKLTELFRIAENYTVLRDGRTIESGAMQDMTHDELIRKMVGRDITVNRNTQEASDRPVLLRLTGGTLTFSRKKLLDNVSFHLHSGEILGLFGLMGAGRTELTEALMGTCDGDFTGTLIMNGGEVKFKSASEAIKAGLALVPEDRKKDGLVLGMDVQTNIALSAYKTMLNPAGLISNKAEQALAGQYISRLKIKTPSAKQTARNLSGGNQQKIVIAKCLATNPKILILDEPTRGIDINAKNEIYQLIAELASSGMGIIMVSSEIPEILAIADRILVMAEGSITAEFGIAEATEDKILKAAIADNQ